MGQKTTLKISARILLLLLRRSERRRRQRRHNKEQNANERNGKEGRKNSSPLSLSNNSVCVLTRFCFQREHTKTDREEIFISSKETNRAGRGEGRRPRLPPPLRRFRRQKRRVLRRRRATTIQTTANQEEVRRNNTNKFNNK